jgi:hypothetical protein
MSLLTIAFVILGFTGKKHVFGHLSVAVFYAQVNA